MSDKREIVVIGAGGFAAEVIETAVLAGWHVAEIYDDTPSAAGRTILGARCVGPIDLLASKNSPGVKFIFAIGDNIARQRIGARLAASGCEAVALVHPTACVSRTASVAGGTFVGAQTFVGPHVQIGEHAIVNVGASVGHDASVGAFAQLCPGARVSGFAKIGLGAFMGSNAVVSPRVAVGDWAKLGAGSFAARDVPGGKLAIGVPARVVAD